MKHTWSRMGKIECAECEKQDATKWCVVCDDPFCNTCWEDLHRRGNRARHPFCPIKSEDGSIDMSAVGPDGKLLGTSYDVGPQKRGGGEDGDGTVPDEFKESAHLSRLWAAVHQGRWLQQDEVCMRHNYVLYMSEAAEQKEPLQALLPDTALHSRILWKMCSMVPWSGG